MPGIMTYDAYWQSSILQVTIAVVVLMLSFAMVAIRYRLRKLEEQFQDLEGSEGITSIGQSIPIGESSEIHPSEPAPSHQRSSPFVLRTGAASRTGPIRKSNQDRVHAFVTGEYAVL